MQLEGTAALGSPKDFVPNLQNRHCESNRGFMGVLLSPFQTQPLKEKTVVSDENRGRMYRHSSRWNGKGLWGALASFPDLLITSTHREIPCLVSALGAAT